MIDARQQFSHVAIRMYRPLTLIPAQKKTTDKAGFLTSGSLRALPLPERMFSGIMQGR